jgi:hypothetical protein
MSGDASGLSLAFPKSRPKALEKEEKQHALALKDAKENAKARTRAKGQCEVQVRVVNAVGRKSIAVRCVRKDSQTHHLKGGIGRRNRGVSILSDWKLRVCDQCHADITGKILKPTTAEADAHTIRYWRSK